MFIFFGEAQVFVSLFNDADFHMLMFVNCLCVDKILYVLSNSPLSGMSFISILGLLYYFFCIIISIV